MPNTVRAAKKYIINPLLPIGSKRRDLTKRLVKRPHRGLSYKSWIKQKEPKLLSELVGSPRPLISIIVPCYNTPKRYIEPLVESVINQTYPRWQLVIVDGGSAAPEAASIKQAAQRDKRITYLRLDKNLRISANTNAGIKKATGSYIAFLDHDDILPFWALNEVAAAIQQNPTADIFYSDEDRLSENGKVRTTPLFKPDWSPDLFLCVNYLAHFMVIHRALLSKLNNLRPVCDGAQDFDLVLRALGYKPQIVHIPKVLYHMRMAATSTASQIGIKSYAHTAGIKALTDYIKRAKLKARVVDIADRPTNYRIKYDLPAGTLVSIIIPFKDKVELLEKCITSILNKTDYKNYELILISNDSQQQKTFNYLDSVQANKRINIYHYDKPFNYSALNNFGRRQANGKVLVFLNNDTEVTNGDWLAELASTALQKDKGAVGALLFYPDKTIQHAGVVVGMDGAAGHVFRKLKLGTLTPFLLPDWPRNYLAVTGACLAVEAKKFDKVGGFNEKIIMAGSDVVLGLDLFEAGYLNVYWPYAQLKHHESKSVGSYQNAPPSDYDISIARYKRYLNHKDPYYNSNLELINEWPTLRSHYE